MGLKLRELRYLRRRVNDLDQATEFAVNSFGLMREDQSETEVMLRSDHRFYSLCLSTELAPAIGISVHHRSDLDEYAQYFERSDQPVTWLNDTAADRRIIKSGISVAAPNGVDLEIVWRPMESGQPFHGSRPSGLSGFSAVQLASSDIVADATFWAKVPGFETSDYAGDAQFMTLGGAHHQVAIYPSVRDGLLGAIWQVETLDNVMRNWHFLRDRQVPIAHGPGRQPTSDAVFVTARAPEDFLMSYATEMAAPPELGPRQFRDEAKSHCIWGSPTELAEFKGEVA